MFCNRCDAEINDGVSFCPKCGTPVYNKLEQHRTAVQANAPSRPTTSDATRSTQDHSEARKRICLLESQIKDHGKKRKGSIFSIVWTICLLLFVQSDLYLELVFSLFGSSISNDSTIAFAFATVFEWIYDNFTIVLVVGIVFIILDVFKIISASADIQACQNEIASLRRDPQEEAAPADFWQCACGRKNAGYISSCACGKSKRDAIKH